MARNALIQVRRDTAANWTSVNPTLAAGEQGFETDTGLFKVGDGVTTWNSLASPTLKSPKETWAVSATAATGTVNVDIVTASSFYYTSNASANWTFNFRGNSGTTLSSILTVGSSTTVAFAVTNGATARYSTAFSIDGTAITPKWQGGAAPSAGNASSIDLYFFTIIKTAATPTYTMFASLTKFA